MDELMNVNSVQIINLVIANWRRIILTIFHSHHIMRYIIIIVIIILYDLPGIQVTTCTTYSDLTQDLYVNIFLNLILLNILNYS